MADVNTTEPTGPGSRRQKALATRLRIIEAAHGEFLERGYHGATIAAIARRAGVASQTVYFVFHTKAALISAVVDAAVMGPDPVLPQETDWWRQMKEEPRPDAALRHFIRGAMPLFGRASAISECVRAAALTDAEVGVVHEHHEQLRYAVFGEVIADLAAKGPLREGLDPAAATDIFFVLVGDTVFNLLTAERGWSEERVADWLCETVPLLLFRDVDGESGG